VLRCSASGGKHVSQIRTHLSAGARTALALRRILYTSVFRICPLGDGGAPQNQLAAERKNAEWTGRRQGSSLVACITLYEHSTLVAGGALTKDARLRSHRGRYCAECPCMTLHRRRVRPPLRHATDPPPPPYRAARRPAPFVEHPTAAPLLPQPQQPLLGDQHGDPDTS